jgi:hypothetical protein
MDALLIALVVIAALAVIASGIWVAVVLAGVTSKGRQRPPRS